MLAFGTISTGLRTIEVPPVIVVVGNPSILNVKVEGRFDFVDSYHLKIEVASNYFQKVREFFKL